ncbi:16S rRNA (guanine(966)-N(2))-methyltransferase RsmD [Candidatus Pelagibacter sp.]|nr:16S rRNA (guanine(966)-N(2))-methyltransferase RsmD [Candidatus Pelagibacter sp.]
MRIISGNFKGKKIIQPKDNLTRPLKDLTKESIFNIINHSKKVKFDIKNSTVLDLFAGVGSFGIECLSRGVKHVVFYENYDGVLPILKKNLKSLKNLENFQIIENDVYAKNSFLSLSLKFNIIFLDPPYKDKNVKLLLSRLKNSNIIDPDGIIILHRNKNEKIEIPNNYEIIEERKYGISKILFLN